MASSSKDNLNIYQAIGPKVFHLPLKKLERKFQIKVKCTEVKIPYEPWDNFHERDKHHTISKNKMKIDACRFIQGLYPQKNNVLVSYYIKVADKLGEELGIEKVCNGKSKEKDREEVLNNFNKRESKAIVLTNIIEKMKLKDIDVLISLSYLKGSEREEYKRIGLLKSCNKGKCKIGLYYALVTESTLEEEFYKIRRNKMILHGYEFSILTLNELRRQCYEVDGMPK